MEVTFFLFLVIFGIYIFNKNNLYVSYKPNGQITISGNLDLWEVGYSYPTVLKGDLNSGEISDFWWNGKDLIKIEITKVSN